MQNKLNKIISTHCIELVQWLDINKQDVDSYTKVYAYVVDSIESYVLSNLYLDIYDTSHIISNTVLQYSKDKKKIKNFQISLVNIILQSYLVFKDEKISDKAIYCSNAIAKIILNDKTSEFNNIFKNYSYTFLVELCQTLSDFHSCVDKFSMLKMAVTEFKRIELK